MRLILLILHFSLITTISSKCPEPRKPHFTSCTVFYNCVNLPDGGYVWIPSKCTEGLIFQPYLRMCVLPGDSWTCDTLSTESSIITNRYDMPELINPNETSYLGSTQDPWNFSELIDSSYTTDSIPDEFNQEMATPYPLIEIEETTENKHETNIDNISEINNLQYGYLQAQNDDKKQYSMLNKLIHHLLVYKEITIPLELLASSSLSTSSKPSTNIPLSNKVEFSKVNKHNVLMNYLIQNYIQQNNNLQNNIITGTKLQNTNDNNMILKESNTNKSKSNIEISGNTAPTMFDDLENGNNIILITDNVGNKKYLTIEKYKSLGYHLDSQFVHLIPCLKNVRMPNTTNCLRYYICEPEMVSVIEYSCPLFTAFNEYTRTCDRESYSKCMQNKKDNTNLAAGADNIFQINVPEKHICTEHGKIKDPTSESRYYICYSASDNSQDIKSIQMTCPNSLIFCQSKKVCTTKRLCKTI